MVWGRLIALHQKWEFVTGRQVGPLLFLSIHTYPPETCPPVPSSISISISKQMSLFKNSHHVRIVNHNLAQSKVLSRPAPAPPSPVRSPLARHGQVMVGVRNRFLDRGHHCNLGCLPAHNNFLSSLTGHRCPGPLPAQNWEGKFMPSFHPPRSPPLPAAAQTQLSRLPGNKVNAPVGWESSHSPVCFLLCKTINWKCHTHATAKSTRTRNKCQNGIRFPGLRTSSFSHPCQACLPRSPRQNELFFS